MFALALWLLSRLLIHAIDWIGQHCGGRDILQQSIKAGV
jgi:hypothetical protein